MKTVGIIGGSGFIGSHTTKKFLQEGFKVRVSATDISKKEKYLQLKNLPNAENLEIRPLKVENKKQLKEFIVDIIESDSSVKNDKVAKVTQPVFAEGVWLQFLFLLKFL